MKPLLTFKQKQKHLICHQNWSVDQWNQVAFSSKSKFCISLNECVHCIWRKSHERCDVKCLEKNKKCRIPSNLRLVWNVMPVIRKIGFLKRSANAASRMSSIICLILYIGGIGMGDNEFILYNLELPNTVKSTKKMA